MYQSHNIIVFLLALHFTSCIWHANGDRLPDSLNLSFPEEYVSGYGLPSDSLVFSEFNGDYPEGWPEDIEVPAGLLLADGLIRSKPTPRGGQYWSYHAVGDQTAIALAKLVSAHIPARLDKDDPTEVSIGDAEIVNLQYMSKEFLVSIEILQTDNDPLNGKSLMRFSIITTPDNPSD